MKMEWKNWAHRMCHIFIYIEGINVIFWANVKVFKYLVNCLYFLQIF